MATSTAETICGDGAARSPIVCEPTFAVLNKMSTEAVARLRHLISEPIEFIDSPSFSDAKTSKELFGKLVGSERASRPWCNFADAVDPAEISSGVPTKTLNGDQERQLFLQLNYARYRMAKIIAKFAGKRLTSRATAELMWWDAQTESARIQIVQSNVPLVLAMAKRTRLSNIDYAELISEGNMALLRSTDKFDCGRGFKFSTYACRAILKSFSRVAMKMSRYRSRFPTEFDPAFERSDYAEQQRLNHEADCVSELRDIIRSNAADLNAVEVKVIQARFALATLDGPKDEGPKTLEQVGLLIGVTKERVRQIQNRALSKLREKLQEDFLAA